MFGDSLLRDAAMANRAGVKSVWARYGTEVEADLWRQLIRVTHWTVANVANEERLRVEYKDTRPDPTIDSFDALLSHFHFVSPVTQIAGTKASQLEIEWSNVSVGSYVTENQTSKVSSPSPQTRGGQGVSPLWDREGQRPRSNVGERSARIGRPGHRG
jgi:hypothetical protein